MSSSSQSGRFQIVDLALFGVALIWGLNGPVVKASLEGWAPSAFNAIRFLFAAALLFGYLVITDRNWRLQRQDIWRVALLGTVGNFLYQWLYIEGISRSTASNTGLILGMAPLVVTLWGAAIGVDRLTSWVLGGTVMSAVGVAIVFLAPAGGFSFSSATLVGDMIVLAGVTCWSAYTVYARPVIARVGSSLRVTAWGMVFGALLLMLVGAPSLTRQDIAAISGWSWAGMAFSAGLSLSLSYLIYGWGVQRVGGARTAIYINLVPVIAALTALLTLGERWTPLQWAGAALVIAGVTLAKLEGYLRSLSDERRSA